MGIGHGVPLGNGPQLQQGLVGAEIMILTMGEAMVCAVKTYHYYGMVKINRGNMGKLYQKKKIRAFLGHFWPVSGLKALHGTRPGRHWNTVGTVGTMSPGMLNNPATARLHKKTNAHKKHL